MEWRIRKSSHGGVYAEYGLPHNGGCRIPGMLGVTMPAFIVYESVHFDTEKKALSYIRKREGK